MEPEPTMHPEPALPQTREELRQLVAAEIATHESERYRSFLSQLSEGRIPDTIRSLSAKGDSAGVDYLLAYYQRFGAARLEAFVDHIYEEIVQGTTLELSDFKGAGEKELFQELFKLKQPDTSYVDSVTRRDFMRFVGRSAGGLLATEAALTAGSFAGYALTKEDDKAGQKRLARYNEFVVLPATILSAAVISAHYHYENNVDHINAQLDQIERKMQRIEDAIDQLVDRGKANRRDSLMGR
jgi:hypothetical protein